MFGEIGRFLIDTVFSLFGAALLLRAWLLVVRVPPYDPFSRGIVQATDWLIQPLRRIVRPSHGVDWACLVAAWLAAFAYLLITVCLFGGDVTDIAPVAVLAAILVTLRWALNLVLWLTLLASIVSWVNPRGEAAAILFRLTQPILDPVRKRLPRTGAIDLSALVVLVLTQIALMIVARASFMLFGWWASP
jgi:YggT family protein